MTHQMKLGKLSSSERTSVCSTYADILTEAIGSSEHDALLTLHTLRLLLNTEAPVTMLNGIDTSLFSSYTPFVLA